MDSQKINAGHWAVVEYADTTVLWTGGQWNDHCDADAIAPDTESAWVVSTHPTEEAARAWAELKGIAIP